MATHDRRSFLRALINAGVVASAAPWLGCEPQTTVSVRYRRRGAPDVDASTDDDDGGTTLADADDGIADALTRLDFTRLTGPDELGLWLPEDFHSKVIARSGEPVLGEDSYVWHPAPDGGATFAAEDGGWIYVSNSEVDPGGVGAVRFDDAGRIVDAYSILSGQTRTNCAGGPTPWGTWLSCEEHPRGLVWECDPWGKRPAVALPDLGTFVHEAISIDPVRNLLYLTEDTVDGRLYRFVPDAEVDGHFSLHGGSLEVMIVDGSYGGNVTWAPVRHRGYEDDLVPLRYQVEGSTPFNGGEGIWWHDSVVYFSTKGDDRIWAYDLETEFLRVIYDGAVYAAPLLSGVDNLVVSAEGHVLVAEDQGHMRIVAITQAGHVVPIMHLEGQGGSEITGPAFDPSGSRLYFSSQRGVTGKHSGGITYEIRGPFEHLFRS